MPNDEKIEKITFRCSTYLHELLTRHAASRPGVPLSVIIRDLLEKALIDQSSDRKFRRKINK